MILLGVTGSIAAYKSVEIVRLLVKAGQEVHIIMTPSATQFIGPLTFQALSGNPVLSDVLDVRGTPMAHLELSEKASVLLVAPASAESLSQMARGGASDLVSASVLSVHRATTGKLKTPIYLAPAMHEAMWNHPATEANVKTLKGYGYQFIGPETGDLGRAGDSGAGRMAEPETIVKQILHGRAH